MPTPNRRRNRSLQPGRILLLPDIPGLLPETCHAVKGVRLEFLVCISTGYRTGFDLWLNVFAGIEIFARLAFSLLAHLDHLPN